MYNGSDSSDEEYFYFEDPDVPLANPTLHFASFEAPSEILLRVPTDTFATRHAWSLVNLILSIAGVLVFVYSMISYVTQRKRELEDAAQNFDGFGFQGVFEKKASIGKDSALIIIGLLSIAALMLFVFTQSMRLPMVWIDFWTTLHVAAFAMKLLLIN